MSKLNCQLNRVAQQNTCSLFFKSNDIIPDLKFVEHITGCFIIKIMAMYGLAVW